MRAALILAMLSASAGWASAATSPGLESIIEISASATVRTPPDVGVVTFNVRGEGADTEAAAKSLVAKRTAIERGLGALQGAQIKVQTGEMRLSETRAPECENRYGAASLSEGTCRVTGRIAELEITLRLTPIKDTATALALAGQLGAGDGRISYEVSDTEVGLRRATAAAIANAQGRAAAAASAAGRSLGPILKLDDNSSASRIVLLDGQRQTVEIGETAIYGANAIAGVLPVNISVAPEDITATANVTVTYRLAP